MIIRLLIIENAPFEINVIKNELSTADFEHVAEFIEFTDNWKTAFDLFKPNIVIVGYEIMSRTSLDANFWQSGDSNIPVLSYADTIGEENAILLIKRGIADIVFKNNITALVPKIRASFEESIESPNPIPSPLNVESNSKAILENCMEGILFTIPDGKILAANPAACEMLGVTEQEMIAGDRLSIVDTSDPNLPILADERRRNGKAKGILRFKRKDGTIFPALTSSRIFTDVNGNSRAAFSFYDITSSYEAEQQLLKTKNELAEAYRQLHKTLEASQDMICSVDNQARFVEVSAACETILGYTAKELIGRTCYDFIVPDDHIATRATAKDIKEGHPVTFFENRYWHKSGHIVHMLWSAKWDDNEKLIYAIAKDITENKRLEKICEVERRRFLDLYELAPCSLGILKGPEHIFEMANPLYLQLINRGQDIIGKSVKEVLPELEEQGIFDLLDHVYQTGGSFVANEKLFQLDKFGNGILGDFYLNLMYMAHRNSEGHIDGILFFAIDVTEQVVSRLKIEESAKLYRNLIMELPVAAYSCDALGNITIYNKAAVNLWGREPEIGIDMWCGSVDVMSPDGDPMELEDCPMAIALKEGRTVSGMEIMIRRPDGEYRNILPHAVPYFNGNNEIVGAVNMLTDITDSKRAEINLKRQNEELLKANKELDRFVYSVSHDLRSPLTSMLGLARFIEEESAEPETLEHIRMIIDSINRLDGFIKKILAYSQNNRTTLEVETIAINEKFARIINSLKNMSAGQQIDFQIDITEDYPFATDRQRFSAIIENLISNAIKYHNPEETHKFIKIVGRVTPDAFHFSIYDNGIGIAPQYHQKIFDMFFRVSGNAEGSGIGLYIVKDMVEKLGGEISVNSRNDVTQFDVVLKNFLKCQE